MKVILLLLLIASCAPQKTNDCHQWAKEMKKQQVREGNKILRSLNSKSS